MYMWLVSAAKTSIANAQVGASLHQLQQQRNDNFIHDKIKIVMLLANKLSMEK